MRRKQLKNRSLLENTFQSHSYKICPKHARSEFVTAVADI